MKLSGHFLALVTLTLALCNCSESDSSSGSVEVATKDSEPTTTEELPEDPPSNATELDFDPSDAEAFSKAYISAMRDGTAEELGSFAIEYDRQHFIETYDQLKELPPIPKDPDLWVRTYEGKDAGRVSVRNWEPDITFNLILREGRWWAARSN